jgi:hypothetical protein
LSNSTGAELLILRILEDVQKFDDVSVEGYNEDSQWITKIFIEISKER